MSVADFKTHIARLAGERKDELVLTTKALAERRNSPVCHNTFMRSCDKAILDLEAK